jgi:hypothetical protein
VEEIEPAKDRRRRRLRAALPPLKEFAIGSLVWGAMMALSALLALGLRNGLQTDSLSELLAVYGLGGLFAWPFMIPLARVLAFGRAIETRFAAFFLALSVGTMAMTAFLFAMDYRIFYSRWHAPFGSEIWVFQFLFTGASAVYQFAVLGSRLFMPLGLLFLAATSLYLAKRMR